MSRISRIKVFILAMVFSGAIGPVLSQEVYYQNYTSADGMSNTSCYGLWQDRQGFIWIATNFGIDRFDGTSFRNFAEKDGFSGSLVRKVKEDYLGRIWVMTYFDGLFHTESSSGTKFQEYELNSNVQSQGPGRTDFKVDRETGVTIEYAGRTVVGLDTETPRSINYYQEGVLFHVRSRLRVYSGGGVPIHKIVRVTEKDSQTFDVPVMSELQSFPIYLDSNSIIYGKYLLHFNTNGLEIDTLPETTNCFEVLNDGSYLLGTTAGLWVYNRKNRTSQLLISDIIIRDILIDGQKNVWAATRRRGLFKIPSLDVITYPAPEGYGTDLIGFATGTSEGICSYSGNDVFVKEPESNEFKKVFHIEDPEVTMRDVLERPGTSEKVLVCNFGQPNIWLINEGACLKKVQFPLTYQMHHGRFRGKELFLTGSHGAYQFDLNTETAKALQPDTSVILCHSLELDSKGQFWFGGMGEIYKETPKGLVSVIDLKTLIIGLDFCDGSLVVATQKKGLYMLDTASMALVNLRKENGLSDDVLSNVMVHNGRVFVASNKGIDIVEKKGAIWEVQTPYISSVLKYPLVTDMVVKEGRLWLCLPRAMISVPLHVTFPSNQWPIQITEVMVKGQTVSASEFSYAYDQNEVTLHFTEPNFLNLYGDKYQYRLVGAANEQWANISSKYLTFPSLQPGDYEFQIKSKPNFQGATAPKAATFSFSIQSPFWKTWWFISLETLVVLLMIYLIVKYQSTQIANREVLKTELVRLELKALKAQINPHFVYNAISSVQYYLSKNESAEAQKYMGDFAHLIRKVLEHSDKSLISLESELALIANYVDLESRKFEGTGVYLKNEIEEQLNPEEVRVPPAIFQPFVENAIFHGLKSKDGQRSLVLRIQKKLKSLVIEIEDNGIGRKKAGQKSTSTHKGPSFGISIASERIQVLNGADSCESVKIKDLVSDGGEALGTRVTLSIPYISVTQ